MREGELLISTARSTIWLIKRAKMKPNGLDERRKRVPCPGLTNTSVTLVLCLCECVCENTFSVGVKLRKALGVSRVYGPKWPSLLLYSTLLCRASYLDDLLSRKDCFSFLQLLRLQIAILSHELFLCFGCKNVCGYVLLLINRWCRCKQWGDRVPNM